MSKLSRRRIVFEKRENTKEMVGGADLGPFKGTAPAESGRASLLG